MCDFDSLFVHFRAIPSKIPQCKPRCTDRNANPQYAQSICTTRAAARPPLTGRNENTCRERMIPLSIEPSMVAHISRTITVCRIRGGVYLPRNRFLYQLLFRKWCRRNSRKMQAPSHSCAASPTRSYAIKSSSMIVIAASTVIFIWGFTGKNLLSGSSKQGYRIFSPSIQSFTA